MLKDINLQKIAQDLVDKLQSELTQTKTNAMLLEGAVKGVDLLYSELTKQLQELENVGRLKDEDNKPKRKKKTK